MYILSILLIVLLIGLYSMLRKAEMRISQLEDRVRSLEASPRVETADEARETPEALLVASEKNETPEQEVETLEEEPPAPVAALVEEEEPEEQPQPKRPRENLESWIGARWPVWVGGLALALGGVFMAKYSIEQGLISPAVRLGMAGFFGLLLLALGEWVRRREEPLDIPALRNALVPGALTAAGAVTLFGAIYAAHSIFGYIGPVLAFVMLAVVALGAVGLSLLHGQALAGLGLLAAMVTPALVQTDSTNAWALFGYIAIAWLATNAASRIRGWNIVPSLANLFLLGWSIVYLLDEPVDGAVPVIIAQLVMVAGLALLWPAGDGEALPSIETAGEKTGWRRWYEEARSGSRHRWLRGTGSFTVLSVAIAIAALQDLWSTDQTEFSEFAVLIAAMAAWGAWRRSGAIPSLFALAGVAAGLAGIYTNSITSTFPPTIEAKSGLAGWYATHGLEPVMFALAADFALAGVLALYRHARNASAYAVLWSFIIWIAPLALLTGSFLNYGNFDFDLIHGVMALAYALFFGILAQWVAREQGDGPWLPQLTSGLVIGSYLSLVLALHALTQSVVTTILVAITGFGYLMASRKRPWPILPWIMGLAGVVVLARIGWEPSLVGDMELSKTPFFNQLLPGYGIPAILTALGAYAMKDWPDLRVRNFLQAMASLLALMTVAILVRHAMNGGVLSGNAPTLGEQSIYTLLTVGGSAVLMTLDMRAPSPVFRWGSMMIGGVSMLFAVTAHLFALNPFVTGELTGQYPFFNLLLIGYLLPSLAFFGLAAYARGKRPVPYIYGISAAGAVLAFAWVTLTVRRFWQGPGLGEWKGYQQGEMYSYSVVWLVLGVVLLAAGSRFHAKSLRLASALLVLVAVLKVFLIDMSNLEGILRALSFIGLGAVLIGIGLFYQHILRRVTPPAESGLQGEGEGDTPV